MEEACGDIIIPSGWKRRFLNVKSLRGFFVEKSFSLVCSFRNISGANDCLSLLNNAIKATAT